MANYNEYVRRVYWKIITTAADFYEPDEDRTIQVMGKDSKWISEKLDPKHLAKNFDIRIQNSSALPKSQAARTQMIMDLSERFPTLFAEDQILEMLDLGKTDRFFNEGTAAVRAAEEIYEMITQGKPAPDPAGFEYHIPYWKVFSSKIQDHAFRDLPIEIQERILEYLSAREMMMIDKATSNQMFAAKLAELEQFPLVFEPEPVGPPPPMEGAMQEAPMEPMAPMAEPGALGQPQLEEVNPNMPPIEPGAGQIGL